MTLPERRLAGLDAISRTRSLTEAEQVEVMLRAREARKHKRRRERYRTEPDYRLARINEHRARKGISLAASLDEVRTIV